MSDRDIKTIQIGPDTYQTRHLRVGRSDSGVVIVIDFDEEPSPAPESEMDFRPGEKVIDVSHHNGLPPKKPIDWAVVKDVARVEKVIVRVSRGREVDRCFPQHWVRPKRAGMWRAAYHYWENEVSPIEQYDVFMRAIGSDPGEGTINLDVEDRAPVITPIELDEMRGWLQKVRAATGKRTRFYTGTSVYDWPNAPAWVANEYPDLWKAQYTRGPCAPLKPWGYPVLWQVSGYGRIPGVDGNVDLNVGGDGKNPPVRDWWWTGCFADKPDDNGVHHPNYFVSAVSSPMDFYDAPRGNVFTTRPVPHKMQVRMVTADGWLCVLNDGAREWWCNAEAAKMTQ